MPRIILLLAVFAMALAAFGDAPKPPRPALRERAVQLRRPVALVHDGDNLIVANRRSGTLSVVDLASDEIIAEHKVATQIADAVRLAAGEFLVVDDAAKCLVRVTISGGKSNHHKVADLPNGPAKVTLDRDHRRCFITATWARCLVALDFDDAFQRVVRTQKLMLEFAPREMLRLGDGALVVADAFGGKVAFLDGGSATKPVRLKHVRRVHGHNIRGLAATADGKQLHIAQQQMVPRAKADYEELHWGRMLVNGVHVLAIDDLLAADEDVAAKGWTDAIGGIGGAAGDPTAVIIADDETSAVAFGGVGEVVVRAFGYAKRIPVGERPTDMTIIGSRLFVANQFDDSLSVIDIKRGVKTRTISLGQHPAPSAVDRGERLFFDARLSHDGWMSCHSCHTDGHSSDLVIDTLGDGDYGAPKRVPSLLGTRDTGPWGWTGNSKSLSDQVQQSIESTMHGERLTPRQLTDLVAYLESLPAAPGVGGDEKSLVKTGAKLFAELSCSACHQPPTFSTPRTYDVGLADERDRREFNAPSLRGVSQRSRLFHDGRAAGVGQVVLKYRHQIGRPLQAAEAHALIAFLCGL